MSENQQLSDHDLLIRLDEKQDALMKMFTNHLRHHWAFTMALITLLGSSMVTIIIALVK